MIKVYRYRIKDSTSAKHLERMAGAVSYVWNYCNQTQRHAIRWEMRWPTGFDLSNLCAGSSKELGLHSQTIQAVCEEYATRRQQFKKRWLRWRVSNPKSPRRSLGWIPFKRSGIKFKGDSVVYLGQRFRLWNSRDLEGTVKTGSFSQDARGRWYINIACEVSDALSIQNGKAVGIDLGLKTLAAIHDGKDTIKVEARRFYRDLEPELAKAQRRENKKRTRILHAKIANRRKDHLHKLSTEITNDYQYIFIGNVSSTKLAKTRMAKSVLDAGWGMFRTFVETKAMTRKSVCLEINESYSTVECSVCHERTGPTGFVGLGIREWNCSNCNTLHDRDANSGAVIRQRGLLAVGHHGRGGNPQESHAL